MDSMREVWKHDIEPTLREYAGTLERARAGIFINGVGEIGLSLLKLALNAGVPIAGIHEPHPKAGLEQIALRLGFGRHDAVCFDESAHTIHARGQTIPVLRELTERHRFEPHGQCAQTIVVDCSGFDFTRARAQHFLDSGAEAVFFSGPGATEEERQNIPLLLHGVTLDRLRADTRIGSMGSCTTNSVVAPILALHEAFGVEAGTMISVHSATNSDSACDTWNGRGILDAIGKPGGSGALKLVGLLVRDLENAFAGGAIRVPAADGSITYLTLFVGDDSVTVDRVNGVLEKVAERSAFFGLNRSSEPLTISDVRESYYLAWLDPRQTRVVPVPGKGVMVQLASAYSNKWGYAAALLALPARWAASQ
jgi:glyceraldehyde-3-phosphate dehydrogenase type I